MRLSSAQASLTLLSVFTIFAAQKKGSYQSGQMGLTVTQLAYAFGGSNPSLPTKQLTMQNADLLCILDYTL